MRRHVDGSSPPRAVAVRGTARHGVVPGHSASRGGGATIGVQPLSEGRTRRPPLMSGWGLRRPVRFPLPTPALTWLWCPAEDDDVGRVGMSASPGGETGGASRLEPTESRLREGLDAAGTVLVVVMASRGRQSRLRTCWRACAARRLGTSLRGGRLRARGGLASGRLPLRALARRRRGPRLRLCAEDARAGRGPVIRSAVRGAPRAPR